MAVVFIRWWFCSLLLVNQIKYNCFSISSTNIKTTIQTLVKSRFKPLQNHPQTTHKPPTNHPKTTHKPPTNHPQTTHKPPTNHPQTTHKPPTNHPQTTHKPPKNHPQTTHKPPTNLLQTTHKPPTNHQTPPRPPTKNSSSWKLMDELLIWSMVEDTAYETIFFTQFSSLTLRYWRSLGDPSGCAVVG